MNKMSPYIPILVLYFLLHAIFIIHMIERDYTQLEEMLFLYLPLSFSLFTALFTYIIYVQNINKPGKNLIWFLLTGSIAFFLASESGQGNMLAKLITSVSFLFNGWFFYHFIIETLKYKRIIKRTKNEINKMHLLLLITIILVDIISSFIPSAYFFIFTRTITVLTYIFYIVYPICLMIYLFIKGNKNPQHKLFLIWMCIIPIIAFSPFFLLYAIPFMLDIAFLDPYITTLSFFALPIGYTYLIVTQELLDLKLLFNRMLYYCTIGSIPSLIIAFILIFITSMYDISVFFQYFAIIYICIIIFLAVKDRLDFHFRKHLFPNNNDVITFIERTIEELATIVSIKELDAFIGNKIKSTLRTNKVSIIKHHPSSNEIELKDIFESNCFQHLHLQHLLKKNKTMVEYEDTLGIFLNTNKHIDYYLWVGHKNKGKSFNIREKSWFIVFSSYVKLVYENIFFYEQSFSKSNQNGLITESRFLFHFAEKERKKLANDIHDTIIQEQIYWFRTLNEFLNENHYWESKELLTIKDGLYEVIQKTREVCETIQPVSILEQGFSYALETLLERFSQRAHFTLYYEVDMQDEIFLDYEKPIAIYRIIEELLNNAMKHANAKRVSINIWKTNQHILIDYLDDGIGFPFEEASQYGLKGMTERVKTMNGLTECETNHPGEVKIYITIPR